MFASALAAVTGAVSHVAPHFVKIIPFKPIRLMEEVVTPPAADIDLTSALSTVFDLASQCFQFITSNPLLMIFLVITLVPTAFGIISAAKGSLT